MVKPILLLAACALLGAACLMPAASASQCLAYQGDLRDPDVGVTIPLIRGYGPCSPECSGVVYVDKGGASGCVLPEEDRL